MGAIVSQSPDGHDVMVEARDGGPTEAPYELVKTMRASFLVLGPLVARFGHARVSTPGGCAIGARPVDLHLAGLAKMGARIRISEGYVEAEAERLRGAKILLDFPSVGATQQLMMAASLADGTTVIENAAREPARRRGCSQDGRRVRAGTSRSSSRATGLRARSRPSSPTASREGTYMVAAAITGGSVRVVGARAIIWRRSSRAPRGRGRDHPGESGLRVEGERQARRGRRDRRAAPRLPTDLRAQFTALMTRERHRRSRTVFRRLQHIQALARMGSRSHPGNGRRCTADHAVRRRWRPTFARRLPRAGRPRRARTTRVSRVYHLDRGYEHVEAKLGALGADVRPSA
jgi:UDP-N-acetylglucosamine 1-carboxyvinyltransferase